MGAWSATIMGNDSIMDAEWTLENFCGVDSKKDEKLTKEIIEDNIERFDFMERELIYITGAKVLELGPERLPENLKSCIIGTCKSEIEEGCKEWNDPEERIFYLKDFIERLEKYDGKPNPLPYEGLFEKIYKGMAAEKNN